MTLHEKAIDNLEKALGIKLYEEQKQYILFNKGMDFNKRQNGKTYAYCIKLALSDGDPLNMLKPEDFCDFDYGEQSNRIPYARGIFRHMFMDIHSKLKEASFYVRPLGRKV